MIQPLTARQQVLIVSNVLKALQDITKLNKTGYNFLYLASGFIAHYNLYGFMDYYKGESLRAEIISHASMNQWSNFRKGEENYEYYMSKKAVYNSILEKMGGVVFVAD